MKDFSTVGRHEPEISATGPGMDAPLWLLQKDETRFLYFSIFLSIAVHIILFAVMAATRIFHPFAGASQEFDLVWFSPAAVTAPTDSSTQIPSEAIQEKFINALKTPAADARPATETMVKTEPQPPPPADSPPPPANNPPQAPPATAQLQTAKEVPIEEPSEMVISRFDGKVVDVVDKKTDVPSFTVISSVKIKSESAQAVVQTIRESGKEPRKRKEVQVKAKPSEAIVVASLPKTAPAREREGAVAVVAAPANQISRDKGLVREKPIPGKISSTSISVGKKQPLSQLSVNRSINSFAAALNALSASGSKLAMQEQAPQSSAIGATGSETTSSPPSTSVATPPTLPVTVEKPDMQKVKQAPQPPPPPQLILHPPVAGDLKLVITGDIDIKVEVYFRPFPKNRRSKPFTRREAEKRSSVLSKMVRTRENVQEAVVESTEDGIYFIVLQPGNGKKGSAELVLKIRESRPGATSKKIGSRKIDTSFEVAKVLMPEGILWNDDSYFTGDMEDADSITKFHSGTGLMWREYK